MARTTASGNVTTWAPQAALNYKRSATAAAINGNHVYITGGMDDQGVLRSVEMAQISEHGKLGHIQQPDTALAEP